MVLLYTNIDLDQFDDAVSYRRYVRNSVIMLTNYGWRSITNDIGFLVYLTVIEFSVGRFFDTLYLISAVNILTITTGIYLLANKNKFILIIVILSSGIFMQAYLVHLRQGAALSIFILFLLMNNFSKLNFSSQLKAMIKSSLLASLFHTSFLFLFLYICLIKLGLKVIKDQRAAVFFALVLMAMVSFGQTWFATLLGARQTYAGTQGVFLPHGIGGGFIFFSFLLFAAYLSKLRTVVTLPQILILLYLALYLVNPLSGRFLIFLFPIIQLALSQSKNYNYYALFTLIFNVATFGQTLEQMT